MNDNFGRKEEETQATMGPKKNLKADRNQQTLMSLLSPVTRTSAANTASTSNPVSLLAEPTTSTDNQVEDVGTSTCTEETKKDKKPRSCSEDWKKDYPWLTFDSNKKLMFCTVCLSVGPHRNNAFVVGCDNFRKSTVRDHVTTKCHIHSVAAPRHRENQETCQKVVFSKQEKGMATAVRAVHWMVQEDLALSKYTSLMQLLQESGCPDIEALKVNFWGINQ